MLTDKIRDCGVDPQAIMDVWQGKDQVSKAIVNGPVGMLFTRHFNSF